MKRKIIAMIPARLGSKRIHQKNLRLIGDRPLISYVTETVVNSAAFDEVYINSEADIFAEIAEEYGAKFFKRPENLAQDSTNNDEFLQQFCQSIDGDIVVQILPTSPFITTEEIQAFVTKMLEDELDTLVSTVEHQIACVKDGHPLNFSKLEPHISSQDMQPVASYATALMAWRKASFIEHMERLGFGYHGADGKTAYFPLKGFSTIDIDNEVDFRLAESVAFHLKNKQQDSPARFYQTKVDKFDEADVPSILKIDGIDISDFEHENLPLTNLKNIISSMDNSRSWCYRLVNSESNSATLISQLPGEGNRRHYHPDWNEWWYIVDGEWQWDIEDIKLVVKTGDIVYIEKNKWHKITAIGDKPAIRLAVSRADVIHSYENKG